MMIFADRIKNNFLPSTLGLFDIVTEEIDNISVIKILISSGLEKPYYISSHVTSESCFAPQICFYPVNVLSHVGRVSRNSAGSKVTERKDVDMVFEIVCISFIHGMRDCVAKQRPHLWGYSFI